MKQSIFLFLFSLGSLLVQAQDYFPLVAGSTWVYRSMNGAGPLTVRVGQQSEISGQFYHRLDGYAPSPVFIRQGAQNTLLIWDEATKTEVPFLLFDGKEFGSVASPCAQKGKAEERVSAYKGPVGNSDTARMIRYTPGLCADLGVTREVFVPYLGMVQRAVTSIVGERTFDLVYAQIGGITYISESGISFSISLTALPSEGRNSMISARLVLNNRTDQDLVLQFNSGQRFDFTVLNQRGETVYVWSSNRLFTQEARQESIKGEEVWQDSFSPGNLPAGTYSVEGRLTNADGKRFSATASINLP